MSVRAGGDRGKRGKRGQRKETEPEPETEPETENMRDVRGAAITNSASVDHRFSQRADVRALELGEKVLDHKDFWRR